ncbi:MAG: monofunctional biosynthetic peptidoglycan transglycosylase [Bacteroidetes bacterium]|nr:monofunctional biosynthetic peptidoglycan transglycosylase [Bacteroidota bacterium]
MLKKIGRFIVRFIIGFFVLSILSVIAFRWVPVPITPLMLIRCTQQAIHGKPVKLKKAWMPLDKISPNLQLAVVCSEDQNFINHMGFDIKAIQEDIEYNKTHKDKRGASTISQQTAKNVFLWPGRSFLRKGLEVYFTFLIETFWSKQRIMEVYLNVIEMGDGIYGAEAASMSYYKCHAKNLSPAQAAAITSILPGPLIYKINSQQSRQHWILLQMANFGGVLDYNMKPIEAGKK